MKLAVRFMWVNKDRYQEHLGQHVAGNVVPVKCSCVNIEKLPATCCWKLEQLMNEKGLIYGNMLPATLDVIC